MVFLEVENIIAGTRATVSVPIATAIVALSNIVRLFTRVLQHDYLPIFDAGRLTILLFIAVFSCDRWYSSITIFVLLEILIVTLLVPPYHRFEVLHKEYSD